MLPVFMPVYTGEQWSSYCALLRTQATCPDVEVSDIGCVWCRNFQARIDAIGKSIASMLLEQDGKKKSARRKNLSSKGFSSCTFVLSTK